MSNFEIDRNRTVPDNARYSHNVVCPECGWENLDSWESGVDESGGIVECGGCEKEFYCCQSISIDYTSAFIKEIES